MNKSVEIKQYKHKMLQYFSFFFTLCKLHVLLVKVRKIYRKYITNKTISKHQLQISIALLPPTARVLSLPCVGTAFGEGGLGLSLYPLCLCTAAITDMAEITVDSRENQN